MIKRIFLAPVALLATIVLQAQVVVPPSVKAKTAFAIVVDKQTYDKANDALYLYKNAVELDGLATYIIYASWSSPDEVKAELVKLYEGSTPLEGAVLIGDVPIALIRNAQHMTTAFKMNEDGFPFAQSSVPSDRFYDDLNLTFDFIKQDSIQPLHFYYKLREDSPQTLHPSFYSARIKYPEERGGNKYEAIARYLRKAAAAKRKQNKLDQVVSFTGSGYNSECLTAWADEEKALRENFPLAFASGNGCKLLNFRMNQQMKFRLFDELQRAEVDVFMFHEHGLPTKQLINNDFVDPSFETQYSNIRSALYASVRRSVAKGAVLDTLVKEYEGIYGFSRNFYNGLYDKELKKKDSTLNADIYIDVKDLMAKNTYPTFVMFDACYNGSFHEDSYLAGYYIFNDGGTLVAQANTRNVLQDRWTIEMVGLLSQGLSVGQYNKLIATLEGHLIGDPTVHFTPTTTATLATDIVLHANDTKKWKQYMKSPYADVQALALRMLVESGKEQKLSRQLLDVFKHSQYHTVRMEALKLLSTYSNEDFIQAVSIGLFDSYEVVARNAAIYAGKIGCDVLLKPMAEAYVTFPERERVQYNLLASFQKFPPAKAIAALQDAVGKSNMLNKVAEQDKFTAAIESQSSANNLATITNLALPAKKRIAAVRTVRNTTDHHNVDAYIALVANSNDKLEVRVAMAEALGWFNLSYRKDEITRAFEQQLALASNPQELEQELRQTIARLQVTKH